MNRTIFDLGFYNGDDTAYYLHKGFKVIAVEANPYLCNLGETRFQKEIKDKKLVLLNKAFNNDSNNKVLFYLHPTNLDWSTCEESKTKFWDVKPNICEVETIDIYKLYKDYDIPHFIKCDIESLDYLLIQQINNTIGTKPNYLSFELSRFDYYKTFSYLYVAGYKEFQLINQAALEDEKDFKFTKYSSGRFGEFLPSDKWLSFDECLTRYMKYKELKGIDNKNLALGWIDIHAKL